MRILLTTDVVGGVWRYTVTLVQELTARGHECAVAVVGNAGEDRRSERPEDVAVFERDLRLEWMPDGLEDVDAGTEWLLELTREWGPDVVHLNQLTYATGAFDAPVVVVAHSDVLSWFDEVRGESAPEAWAAYRQRVSAGLAAADLVVAPTRYQGELLARHYGQASARVIHNGTRPPADDDTSPPPHERTLALVAGRAWDEAKGIELLDRAVGALGDAAPPIHLVGPLEGPVGERVEVDHLITHGEVDGATMGRFYSNARIYVAPSLYEPFGLAPLEAAGHGCSLVLSGIGSFQELWSDAALFFDPRAPESLTRTLRQAFGDPGALDAAAEEATRRARTRYTARRMAEEYEAVYRELSAAAPEARPTPLAPGPAS